MDDQRITLTQLITLKLGNESCLPELRAGLARLVAQTKEESCTDCLEYTVYEQRYNPGFFMLLEVWTNKEALARHKASRRLGEFMRKFSDLFDWAATAWQELAPAASVL